MEGVLEQPQLRVASDERGLEPVDPLRTSDTRQHAGGTEQLHRPALALQNMRTDVVERDRSHGEPLGLLVDPHLAGLGGALHARRRIDGVAGDHALTAGAEIHGNLAGDDSGAQSQPLGADLCAEQFDCGDQIEPGAHCPLGVTLGGDRGAPDGHHRVADELLDHAAVASDHRACGLEVARQQFAHYLGIA